MNNTSRTSRIFVLNGSPRAGKNTFVDMIPNAVHYSYVDLTRRILDTEGINYKFKSNSARVMLETINNALEEYDDIPFKDICGITDNFLNELLKADYLFIDIRKPENIKRFVGRYKGARTVYVDNKKPLSSATLSDSVVTDYEYDFYIDNSSSLENLTKEVVRFITTVEGENR